MFKNILDYLYSWLERFAKPSTPKPTPTPTPTPNPGSELVTKELMDVITLINQNRANNGLRPLVLNAKLIEASQKHSDWMAKNNKMSHAGANNSKPADRIATEGYRWSNAGENIAMGYPTAAAVVTGWMNSAGHRANILGNYAEIGVGVAPSSNGAKYWTTNFATPLGASVATVHQGPVTESGTLSAT